MGSALYTTEIHILCVYKNPSHESSGLKLHLHSLQLNSERSTCSQPLGLAGSWAAGKWQKWGSCLPRTAWLSLPPEVVGEPLTAAGLQFMTTQFMAMLFSHSESSSGFEVRPGRYSWELGGQQQTGALGSLCISNPGYCRQTQLKV